LVGSGAQDSRTAYHTYQTPVYPSIFTRAAQSFAEQDLVKESMAPKPPARGPAPVLMKDKEVDALYELLGWVQDALAGVPWTLTGGSALGAIRSESILFCDDDVDLAIIGREHIGRARAALKACPGAYYAEAGGRKGLPWDRVRHRNSPRAWVDVFLLVEYASLAELRRAVGTRRNGEAQDPDEVARATAFCASLANDAWPLYHFGELDERGAGLAIRRWPREVVLRDELPFGAASSNFGPLSNLPLPPLPLSYVVRAFGADCMAVYYVEPEAHAPGTEGRLSETTHKQPLREEHYMPVMPAARRRRVASTHDRAALKIKLARMAVAEGTAVPALEAVLVVSNGPRGEALASEFADVIIYHYAVGWGAALDAGDCVAAATARGCRFVAVAAAEPDLGAPGPETFLRRACADAGVELGVFGVATIEHGPLLDAMLEAKGYRRWVIGGNAEGLFVPLPPRNALIAPAEGLLATYVDAGPLAGLGVRVTALEHPSIDDVRAFAAAWPAAPAGPRPGDYLVVLCAGVGSRLGAATPKCCVDVGGATIFQRLCGHAKRNGVRALIVVVGFEVDTVTAHARAACSAAGLAAPAIVTNEGYRTTNTSKSLLLAVKAVPALARTGFLLTDGDLVLSDAAFDLVARFPGTCAAVARPSPLEFSCDDEEAVRAHLVEDVVVAIGKKVSPGAAGECVGLYSISGASFLAARLDVFLKRANDQDYYEDAFQASLVDNGRLDMRVIDVTGMGCVEVDTPEDLSAARALAAPATGAPGHSSSLPPPPPADPSSCADAPPPPPPTDDHFSLEKMHRDLDDVETRTARAREL